MSNLTPILTEEQKEEAWLERNRKRRRKYVADNRKEWNRKVREYYVNNPLAKLKRDARNKVRSMYRNGSWVRQKCELCDKIGEAHHKDYNKPLEVRWLCKKHHIEADARKL